MTCNILNLPNHDKMMARHIEKKHDVKLDIEVSGDCFSKKYAIKVKKNNHTLFTATGVNPKASFELVENELI